MEYFAGLVIVAFVVFIAWRVVKSGGGGKFSGGGSRRKEEK
jgi:hypothetical protein